MEMGMTNKGTPHHPSRRPKEQKEKENPIGGDTKIIDEMLGILSLDGSIGEFQLNLSCSL